MNLYQNQLYMDDILYTASINLPWEKLQDKNILISGATGQIGSFLVDVLMQKNENGLNCNIFALSRNATKAESRFSKWAGSKLLHFISYDINKPLIQDDLGKIEYVLHLASNTHPVLYSKDPIGTIMTNIVGLQNMLEFSFNHNAERFAFASSNEIYGQNRGDEELFDESYCGYIDSNTLRAGYSESKRCGEALCQAYITQKNLDVVIPRLTRSFGPTLLMSDTKALSQFIKKGLANENIVLKSTGTQYFSYTYVVDAVSGLLYVLLKGSTGEAYNIADVASDIMLKDLAGIVAKFANKEVVFEVPDSCEAAGYSTATKARLNGSKLKKLGWEMKYDIEKGLIRTLSILKELS